MKIYCHLISKIPYSFCSVDPSVRSAYHEGGPRPELVVLFTVISKVCLKIVEDFIAVEKKPQNKQKKTQNQIKKCLLKYFCLILYSRF